MTFTKFKKDLKVGNEGEWNVGNFFSSYGYRDIGYNDDYKWDLCITNPSNNRVSYFEVKTDVYERDTGNMAIEIRYRGKPSGISHTEAEFFVYYYKNSGEMYMIKCDELRDLIKQNIKKLKVVMGGDYNQSELVLLNREEYGNHFTMFYHTYEQKGKECDSIEERQEDISF
jgi:hypothetical protein